MRELTRFTKDETGTYVAHSYRDFDSLEVRLQPIGATKYLVGIADDDEVFHTKLCPSLRSAKAYAKKWITA